MPPGRIILRLDALRRGSVDNPQYAATLIRFGDNHFHWIGGGAEDVYDLRHVLDAAKDIDRKSFLHHDHECVARAHHLRISNRESLQPIVIPIDTNQALARRLIERNAKLHLGRRIDDSLVEIFNGLDEMARAKDQVPAIRYFQPD